MIRWAGSLRISNAPKMAKPLKMTKLFCALPVRSAIQPTAAVLTKPAMLPIELMMAKPAAAAAPVRNEGGTLQKAACMAEAPAAANVSATMVSTRLSKWVQLKIKPKAAINPGIAVW